MEWVKYPRTRHLPSSRSSTEDDKVATLEEVARGLVGREVVITEKMDGENTTIYSGGHSHARSVDSKFHPSRSIVKELAARISHELPPGYRLCGENIFAVHSIEYQDLESYFQAFGLWSGETLCSWDDLVEWASLLDVRTVPVIYRGPWIGEAHAREQWEKYATHLDRPSEGFVVRRTKPIARDDFMHGVFKFVRKNHVQTDEHWMHQEMRVNKLKELEET